MTTIIEEVLDKNLEPANSPKEPEILSWEPTNFSTEPAISHKEPAIFLKEPSDGRILERIQLSKGGLVIDAGITESKLGARGASGAPCFL
jgi:hypothetical protein